jgi:hypothetical protein
MKLFAAIALLFALAPIASAQTPPHVFGEREVLTHQAENFLVQSVDNVAALRLAPGIAGMSVEARGLSVAGDGGGGHFYWNVGSTAADDGVSIVQPVGTSVGRWLRAFPLEPNVFSGTKDFTGATITVPTQTCSDSSSKAASTSFVQCLIANFSSAVAVEAATTTVLPNTPIYNNGASGIGATLTAGSNGALTVDGYSALAGDRILVKNQTGTLQNGVYVVTAAGDGAHPYILTRAANFNAVSNIANADAIPVINGATNGLTAWLQTGLVSSVGSSTITFAQGRGALFTASTAGIVPASGGGTTNFLRADGAWGPPPGNAATVFVGATSNSGNAYSIASPIPSGFTLTNQYLVRATISATNTGAATLNVNSAGAEPIKTNTSGGLVALAGGEMQANLEYDFTYNTTCTCFVVSNATLTAVTAGTTQTVTAAQWAAYTIFTVTSSGQTLTLPASSSLTANGGILVQTIGQSVTITPNAIDAINAGTVGASITLSAGITSLVTTDGAGNIRLSPTSAGGTPANPTATIGTAAVNGTATTYMRSDAAPAAPTASSSTLGLSKCDNVTITCPAGVFAAVTSASHGALLNIRRFTPGSYTYTPTVGTNSVEIELIGGGGGGGAVAQPGGTGITLGVGGGGAAWLRVYLTSNFSGASFTVGAKGTGGAAGANNGTTGGNSVFTTTGGSPVIYTAGGGTGGARNGPGVAPFLSGLAGGGGATNGDDNVSGGPGVIPMAIAAGQLAGGGGGWSKYSPGASPNILGGSNVSAAGTACPAGGYGGGGAGAVATGTGVAAAGGDGCPGGAIFREYNFLLQRDLDPAANDDLPVFLNEVA